MSSSEQTTAESLARSQIEYIKSCNYQYSAAEYPVDPTLEIPYGWSITSIAVEPLHCTDDGIQKVTITVKQDGETKLTAVTYKLDR